MQGSNCLVRMLFPLPVGGRQMVDGNQSMTRSHLSISKEWMQEFGVDTTEFILLALAQTSNGPSCFLLDRDMHGCQPFHKIETRHETQRKATNDRTTSYEMVHITHGAPVQKDHHGATLLRNWQQGK